MLLSRKTMNKEIGNFGEAEAAEYLRRHGYRILEKNFHCRAGEVDIIAEDHGEIVFVEVKTRSPRSRFSPESAVDEDKQKQIRKVAKYYLSNYRNPSPERFDIVSINLNDDDGVEAIQLKTNAFSF